MRPGHRPATGLGRPGRPRRRSPGRRLRHGRGPRCWAAGAAGGRRARLYGLEGDFVRRTAGRGQRGADRPARRRARRRAPRSRRRRHPARRSSRRRPRLTSGSSSGDGETDEDEDEVAEEAGEDEEGACERGRTGRSFTFVCLLFRTLAPFVSMNIVMPTGLRLTEPSKHACCSDRRSSQLIVIETEQSATTATRWALRSSEAEFARTHRRSMDTLAQAATATDFPKSIDSPDGPQTARAAAEAGERADPRRRLPVPSERMSK